MPLVDPCLILAVGQFRSVLYCTSVYVRQILEAANWATNGSTEVGSLIWSSKKLPTVNFKTSVLQA